MRHIAKIGLLAACLDEFDRFIRDEILVFSSGGHGIAVSWWLKANVKSLLLCRGFARSQMPFPKDSSGITGSLESLGKRLGAWDQCGFDLRLDQPLAGRIGSAWQIGRQMQSGWVFTGKQRGSRSRTDRQAAVGAGVFDPLRSELIQMHRSMIAPAVAAQVIDSQIISQDQDDIGRPVLSLSRSQPSRLDGNETSQDFYQDEAE